MDHMEGSYLAIGTSLGEIEVDVDVGSSSVARSIIGLVLGYITGIVVDLAVLIEVKYLWLLFDLAVGPENLVENGP